jgi:hypothetical protein
VGRIVIETNKETGLDEVELTLDNGDVLKFAGQGRSELHFVRGEQEWIETGDAVRSNKIPGLKAPDHWEFSINVDNIPNVHKTEA